MCSSSIQWRRGFPTSLTQGATGNLLQMPTDQPCSCKRAWKHRGSGACGPYSEKCSSRMQRKNRTLLESHKLEPQIMQGWGADRKGHCQSVKKVRGKEPRAPNLVLGGVQVMTGNQKGTSPKQCTSVDWYLMLSLRVVHSHSRCTVHWHYVY